MKQELDTRNRAKKFKYLAFEMDEAFIEYCMVDEKRQRVSCPLPFTNLPSGEYVIRGANKGQRKEYWHLKGKWYLIADVQKDNGHFICDSARYQLFPSLSKNEWAKIKFVGFKKLNKLWQRHLAGYIHWQNLRDIERNTLLFMNSK